MLQVESERVISVRCFACSFGRNCKDIFVTHCWTIFSIVEGFSLVSSSRTYSWLIWKGVIPADIPFFKTMPLSLLVTARISKNYRNKTRQIFLIPTFSFNNRESSLTSKREANLGFSFEWVNAVNTRLTGHPRVFWPASIRTSTMIVHWPRTCPVGHSRDRWEPGGTFLCIKTLLGGRTVLAFDQDVSVVPIQVHHVHVQESDLLDLPVSMIRFDSIQCHLTSNTEKLDGDQSLANSASWMKYWSDPILVFLLWKNGCLMEA